MRFRIYTIVVLADIEKAFLQIGIQEYEKDVARFLWFKNSNEPEKVERICLCIVFAMFHLALYAVHFYWKQHRSFI